MSACKNAVRIVGFDLPKMPALLVPVALLGGLLAALEFATAV